MVGIVKRGCIPASEDADAPLPPDIDLLPFKIDTSKIQRGKCYDMDYNVVSGSQVAPLTVFTNDSDFEYLRPANDEAAQVKVDIFIGFFWLFIVP